jgi:CMP-N-acetylneuraminic acid synthetase
MKITVYIPAHNYGRYIDKAIQSVLNQTMTDWELIVINDGSVDNTSQILRKYADQPGIRIIEQVQKGLNVSNNIALRLSNARYFMRLDADDYLDENALLVLSNILDTKPEIGLVYPDYYLVDESDEVLEIVRRKKIVEEVELLDLPAHGACTMFRKECLLELGGYAEELDCQDGYELWLRFLQSFKPYNVNVPLFYYRRHSKNLTENRKKILETRMKIKRNFVKNFKNNKIPKILAIIPVVKQAQSSPESAFSSVAGKPLLWYTLDQSLKAAVLDKIVVTSNDDEVLNYSAQFDSIMPIRRPDNLTTAHTGIGIIVKHVLSVLKEKENYEPEAVMILHINTPLRKTQHIEKAIDTMTIFDVDTVVSVAEELAYCYVHEKQGLIPIQKSRSMRIEKKAIYKETGTILLSKVNAMTNDNFHGKKVGHIMMLPEESIKIKSPFDLWQAEKIIQEWRQ